LSIPILKADDDLQVIWGWASVIEEVAGELRRMTAQDSTSGTDKV